MRFRARGARVRGAWRRRRARDSSSAGWPVGGPDLAGCSPGVPVWPVGAVDRPRSGSARRSIAVMQDPHARARGRRRRRGRADRPYGSAGERRAGRPAGSARPGSGATPGSAGRRRDPQLLAGLEAGRLVHGFIAWTRCERDAEVVGDAERGCRPSGSGRSSSRACPGTASGARSGSRTAWASASGVGFGGRLRRGRGGRGRRWGRRRRGTSRRDGLGVGDRRRGGWRDGRGRGVRRRRGVASDGDRGGRLAGAAADGQRSSPPLATTNPTEIRNARTRITSETAIAGVSEAERARPRDRDRRSGPPRRAGSAGS